MSWGSAALAAFFALAGLACLALVVLGIPGTWLLLALAGVVDLVGLVAGHHPLPFGGGLLALCTGLALVGEALEAGAGIAGTRLGGGSRRGMVGAFVGGLLGAIVLTPVLPIPVVGTLIGALVGTFAGAWLGEATAPQRRRRSATLRAAFGAVAGRLAGTLGKLATGSTVWVLLVRAALGG